MESKKVVIPIHCNKYPEQLSYAQKLEQIYTGAGYKVELINLDAVDNPMYVQAYIEKQKPDLLVTIDCAGFDLKLLGDDLFYNSLCIPAMHFLTKQPMEFSSELSERMNFTMEFYVMNEEHKIYIEQNFKRVPWVHRLPEYFKLNDVMKYLSSNEIIKQVSAFPEVFLNIFMNAVEVKEKNRDISNIDVLNEYLASLKFDASEEEKTELIAFVDLAFVYVYAVELEKSIRYILDEIERIW